MMFRFVNIALRICIGDPDCNFTCPYVRQVDSTYRVLGSRTEGRPRAHSKYGSGAAFIERF